MSVSTLQLKKCRNIEAIHTTYYLLNYLLFFSVSFISDFISCWVYNRIEIFRISVQNSCHHKIVFFVTIQIHIQTVCIGYKRDSIC